MFIRFLCTMLSITYVKRKNNFLPEPIIRQSVCERAGWFFQKSDTQQNNFLYRVSHIETSETLRGRRINNFELWCLPSRCLMVSTNQADPSFFSFRILWIWMEQHCFYFFRPLHFVQGLRDLEHWLLQKLSMKIFDLKLKFLIGILVP